MNECNRHSSILSQTVFTFAPRLSYRGAYTAHTESSVYPPHPPPAHTYTHTHTRIHTLDLLPHGAPALFHALYTSASMVVDGMLPFTWPKGQKKKGSYKRFVADIADTHVVLWGCC